LYFGGKEEKPPSFLALFVLSSYPWPFSEKRFFHIHKRYKKKGATHFHPFRLGPGPHF
jgi:hypothetical protein